MKKLLLSTLAMLTFWAGAQAQRLSPPEGFSVIEEQPEGELRIYTRSGGTVSEEDGGATIAVGEQSGTMNLVYGTDGYVYMQRPVSDSYYDGWVRCEPSADGTQLTMPLGQYTAYTFSFDMAVQVQLMVYDNALATYRIDSLATEVVFSVQPDGTLQLQGTDQDHVLGVVNRAFGTTFSYLDNEWLGYGDFATVYKPFDEDLPTPPGDLGTWQYFATSGSFDGAGWVAYSTTVRLGMRGTDAWLQGLSSVLPNAWLHGTRQGSTITFPAGQLMGSYFNVPRYMVCSVPDEEGNPVVTDLVLTINDNGTITTYQDIFLSASKTEVTDFVAYYLGMTLALQPDKLVEVPASLKAEPFVVDYQDTDDEGYLVACRDTLQAGFAADGCFYLQGVAPWLPEGWVKGTVADGQVTFASPQFLGMYYDEEAGQFPFYFQAFDPETGSLLPQVQFAVDADTRVLSKPTAAVGIGIDKTGWLMSKILFQATFTPLSGLNGIIAATAPAATAVCYDLWGRPTLTPAPGSICIRNGRKVMVR